MFSEITNSISFWFENDVKPWFSKEKWTDTYSVVKTKLEDTWDSVVIWWENSALYRWYNNDVKPWFSEDKWSVLYNNIKTELQNKWNELTTWWDTNGVSRWYNNNVKPWFEKDKWNFSGIKSGISSAWGSLTSWWSQNGVSSWYNDKVKPWFEKDEWNFSGIKSGISSAWGSLKSWWSENGVSKWYNDKVKPFFSSDNWNFSGIKDGLKSAWNGAVESIKSIWNNFANWFNQKMNIRLGKIEVLGEVLFEGKTVQLGSLPTFSTGGFPEDGLFMANHSELVGKFSNGKTAVANNEQIIEGITRGVSQANMEEVVLLNQAVGILTELVGAVREGRTITIDGRELVDAYDGRKTRNGYAF